jgi:subtilisin family serine protease
MKNFYKLTLLAALSLNSLSAKHLKYSLRESERSSSFQRLAEPNANALCEAKYSQSKLIVKLAKGARKPKDLNLKPVFSALSSSPANEKIGLSRIYELNLKKYAKAEGYNSTKLDCIELDEIIKSLQARPDIEYAEPDYIRSEQKIIQDPLFLSQGENWRFSNLPEQWNLKTINIEKAWNYSRGENTIIGLVDTGVDLNSPDIQSQLYVNPKAVKDFNNDGKVNLLDLDFDKDGIFSFNSNTSDLKVYADNYAPAKDELIVGVDYVDFDIIPNDFDGHGTFIASIMVSKENDEGMVGAAPDSQLIPIRALGQSIDPIKNIIVTDVEQTLQGMLVAARQGAKVINASYGSRGLTQAEFEVIEFLQDEYDVIVVAAAGNDGIRATNFSPANLPNVISVSATNEFNELASFSNFGSRTTIAAPGARIVGTLRRDQETAQQITVNSTYAGKVGGSAKNNNAFYYLSGTSMASPQVAATVALIKSYAPKLNFLEIRQILIDSSQDFNGASLIQGGLLDAGAALELTQYFKAVKVIDKNGNYNISRPEYIRFIVNSKRDGSYHVNLDLNSDSRVDSTDYDLVNELVVIPNNIDTEYNLPAIERILTLTDTNQNNRFSRAERRSIKRELRRAIKDDVYNADLDFDTNGVLNNKDFKFLKQTIKAARKA